MREIKFRAWDTVEKRYYAPVCEAYRGRLHELLLSLAGDLSAWEMSGLNHQSTFKPPDRYVLEQFTGLKDRNGREIYDGDIVKGEEGEYSGEVWEIAWEQDRAAWSIDENLSDGVEVIGNVHENPELLKGDNG